MIIHVNELEKATGRTIALEGSITVGLPQQPGVRLEDFSFAGKARKEGELVIVEGALSGILKSKCAKCLAPTTYSFEAPFEESFTEGEVDEESDIHSYQGGRIDLAHYFDQVVMLEMPQIFTCIEDCKGLCPTCGKNRNEHSCECVNERIDPRLADLALLFNKENNK
ncbi:DUF177 domain-containing protein [Ammoniphilus sp. CFH 90114]|uniref:YceD family protein n=1 Tax=Ammoniphilus sp. CFH 90114 TaxID=2493665 RepID=UPI00100DD2F9|nr:DUF177 domain-containing protein [Ammoniphilus sp. CFH 90114]RXT15072.1 DUF177 domain-containing protein [Ammoniphilus sp. CFH 90114]